MLEDLLSRRESKRAVRKLVEYAAKIGWIDSVLQGRALDFEGNPIPWYTYPALHFLNSRVLPDLRVLEFGSGQSTLWWAKRVKQVVAIEHDPTWTPSPMPNNVIFHRIPLEENGDYCRAAERTDGMFDVIVIDGRDRVRCCRNSLKKLSERGVVIWDDAERRRYQPGIKTLLAAGFKQMPFFGHSAMKAGQSDTSIFYRDSNCLAI